MIDLKEKLLSSFIAFENRTNIDSYVHDIRSEAIKQFESIGFPNKQPHKDPKKAASTLFALAPRSTSEICPFGLEGSI